MRPARRLTGKTDRPHAVSHPTQTHIDKPLRRALTSVVERYPQLQLAILYGSCARGTQRPGSDVDLALAQSSRTAMDQDTLLDISLECSRRTGREVQLRDLARAEGLFLKQVLTTGVVLLSRDSTVRAELIIRMLDFDANMLPLVRMIRRSNRERLLAGR
ncbi:MAG: nucleotidyltransferase domain-containing protein [Spirochaetaceae bacterium]|nr:MAG: nucleotidyltransferase domain-containing protein [Spirochaetaceae bacterium]